MSQKKCANIQNHREIYFHFPHFAKEEAICIERINNFPRLMQILEYKPRIYLVPTDHTTDHTLARRQSFPFT